MPFDPISIPGDFAGGSSTDSTTYTTAAPTTTAFIAVLIWLHHGRDGAVPSTATSITGTSIASATLVGSVAFNTIATARSRLECWAAAGSGSTGALTITFPETQNGCQWYMAQFAGANSGRGTFGALEFATGAGDAGGSLSLNLSTLSADDSGSRVMAASAVSANSAITPKSGWTEQTDTGAATPPRRFESQVKFDTQDLAPTSTVSGTPDWAMLAIEIAALGSEDALSSDDRRRIISTAAVQRASSW